MTASIIGLCGSARRPSKTSALVRDLVVGCARQCHGDWKVYDLLDFSGSLDVGCDRAATSKQAAAILADIEGADALVVGTPVYKGSYSGYFKHVIDHLDPAALQGTPVALTASGGSPMHALVLEHQLRPLFSFFGAITMPTGVYAVDTDFADGELISAMVRERLAKLSGELSRSLQSG
jgi:FMN reductase